MSSERKRLPRKKGARFSDMTYATTYYYANMVQNVLRDQFGYLRNLDEFYGEGRHFNFTEPFGRYSALHSFIHFCVACSIGEDIASTDSREVRPCEFDRLIRKMEGGDPNAFWLDRLMAAHGIPTDGGLHAWVKEAGGNPRTISDEDISSYYDELLMNGCVETLCEKTSKEVFFLLFLNRELLHTFNDMMARQIGADYNEEIPEEFEKYFGKSGVLKRVRIPRWVQRAVFYRDRGRCVFCQADLSGLVSIDSPEHYDHIVCLAEGGLNDVTNIQLLCSSCNLKKGTKSRGTSPSQELWYSYDD